MAIYNQDGTPYKALGSIQQYNPNSPDLELFDSWDQEIIKQGGSPLIYYECMIQTATMNKTYMEDRGKLFSPVGIQLWGYYEPVTSPNYQDFFGINGAVDVIFELNFKAALNTIGHPPKVGSRIYSPHRGGQDWEIIMRNVGEFKLWGALRLQLVCTTFQESVTTNEGKVTANKPKIT